MVSIFFIVVFLIFGQRWLVAIGIFTGVIANSLYVYHFTITKDELGLALGLTTLAVQLIFIIFQYVLLGRKTKRQSF